MAEINLNSGARQFVTNRHLLWSGLVFLALVFGVLTAFVKPMMLIVGIIGITCVVLMFKYDYFGLIVYLLVFLLRPGETYPALAKVRPELLVGAALSFLTLIKNKYKYGTFHNSLQPPEYRFPSNTCRDGGIFYSLLLQRLHQERHNRHGQIGCLLLNDYSPGKLQEEDGDIHLVVSGH